MLAHHGREVVGQLAALGHPGARVEHQQHRRGHRLLEQALEVLLVHDHAVRRPGRAAAPAGAPGGGCGGAAGLPETGEVDGTWAAERLLRHGSILGRRGHAAAPGVGSLAAWDLGEPRCWRATGATSGLLVRFGAGGCVRASWSTCSRSSCCAGSGPHFDDAVVGLGRSDFNLRWYHVYSTIAFLVANLSNFQLNRTWTFRSSRHSRWWTEYWPFLVGRPRRPGGRPGAAHPADAPALPGEPADRASSTTRPGLRNRLYWSQLIVIALVTPLSFVLNKLWTFAAVRTGRLDLADPSVRKK